MRKVVQKMCVFMFALFQTDEWGSILVRCQLSPARWQRQHSRLYISLLFWFDVNNWLRSCHANWPLLQTLSVSDSNRCRLESAKIRATRAEWDGWILQCGHCPVFFCILCALVEMVLFSRVSANEQKVDTMNVCHCGSGQVELSSAHLSLTILLHRCRWRIGPITVTPASMGWSPWWPNLLHSLPTPPICHS